MQDTEVTLSGKGAVTLVALGREERLISAFIKSGMCFAPT